MFKFLQRAVLACAFIGLFAALAPTGHAQDGILPVTQAYRLSADAGTPGVLKLHWEIAPHYYLYRGRMKFTAGPGITLGEAQLPAGEKEVDPYIGAVELYHHAVDASIPYTVAAGTTRLRVAVRYQGCHEVEPKICYPPHTEQLDLPLPAAAAAPAGASLGAALQALGSNPASKLPGMQAAPLPAEEAFQFSALASDHQHLLLRWTMPQDYYLYRDHITLTLPDASTLKLAAPAWPSGSVEHADAQFGKVAVYFGELELPVAILGDTSGRQQLTVQASFQGCQDGGLCYPLMTRTATVDLAGGVASTGSAVTKPAPAGPLATGLLAALLLALAGGLVLNLMPCVLPVLSLKAVSLLESGENPAHRHHHALAYSAGVLASFGVLGLGILALRSAGHALGWGTQLQQPLLVAVLACVIFALGLSMSGVVQFGSTLGNAGSTLASRAGLAGDFFTGVLAVVVASPCTAPFMGGALAYAFVAPPLHAMAVFLALGLGLALPFLAVGYVPALARLLPRPGRWMETLKQVLAFPMYLTAAWLAWVLANQRGADAVGLLLVAMVLLAMTLWGREQSRSRGPISKFAVLLLALATAAPLYLLASLPPQATHAADGVLAYNPQKLAALRASNTPVFVDMTADWCITCKANEHTVLDTDAFRDALKRHGAVYMKGDWTNEDPAITAFLQHYHSPGVPLYVVFPRGGGEGRVLPTVLTTARVEQALAAAAR